MVTRQWSEVTRPSADCQTTLLDVSSDLGIFWKKSLNGHATVVGGHATVGRLSDNVFWTFQAIWNFFEKSHWTVTRQWSAVTRPSADRQTTFFGRFKQFGIFLKKVTERSRDRGRRSRDRRPTVKQRFLDVSSNLEIFWKKSLNGQATVVGGHATVGRLPDNIFWTFQAIWKFFWKKSLNGHATVVGGHATVGRLSDNVFGRFKQFGNFLKKVTKRSRDSGRRSRDRRPTVKQRFVDVSSDLEIFEKSHWTVTRQWSEVTRPSADCQTTFFWRFKQFGNFLKKVDERSRDSGWKSRDRRPTVRQRFFDVSSNLENFWKKSLNSHATVVGGQATVGRLSNNVFRRFQAIRKFFEKSHWTVTRQWSEVTQPSADCQITFFDVFKQLGEILKEVTERSRDSGRWFTRPSADCRKTFFRCFKQFGNFLKKVTERSRDSGRKSRDRRPCVKHIYAWIKERERERESISVTLHTGTAMLCRWPFHQPASPLKLALTRVGDRQGQLVYEYCKSSHWQVEFMLCDLYL